MAKILLNFLSLIRKRFTYYFFKRKFTVQRHSFRIVSLGSNYGGWSFIDDENLIGSTIISCGLGEDASFDIEFANLYKANIIIVDPTPRAIEHFREIIKNLGSNKSTPYNHKGSESVGSYDLNVLEKSQLQLIEKAVWICRSRMSFYLPRNKTHVSHSIVNFQNDYSSLTDHIQVETTTVEDLINEYKLDSLPILKLDIEGAETLVIEDLIGRSIYPKQILVEYDEMQSLNNKNKKKIYDCHLLLLEANYKLVHRKSINFLYVHDEK
jgi:FkbM family methyltransferase